LGLSFFGLTLTSASQKRQSLFRQIHEIVFHGKGGYDWPTVYNMPIWLRKYTFKLIQDFYKEETESLKKAQEGKGKKSLIGKDGKVSTPQFQNKTSYK